MNDFKIPVKVEKLIKKFRENNAEIYIVGGAVRDLVLNREVKDWDFTTNLTPEEMQKIFPKNSFYNNKCINFFTALSLFFKEKKSLASHNTYTNILGRSSFYGKLASFYWSDYANL